MEKAPGLNGMNALRVSKPVEVTAKRGNAKRCCGHDERLPSAVAACLLESDCSSQLARLDGLCERQSQASQLS